MATIDLHAHAIVPDALSAMAAAHPDHGPVLIQADGRQWLKYPERERLGPLPDVIFDPAGRLAEMDRQRVDIQVIAIPPPNFHYHIPGEAGVDFARIQNDGLLALSATTPDRFHVFGTLALQDIDASVAEVNRIAAFPHVRGVQIGTNIMGTDLDDLSFEPVFSALEAADLPVWLHPDQRSIAGVERLTKYYLQNYIGNPLESTIAMGRIIFGGVMDRHPNLRFGFVHGGGFTPYQISRWDHGWATRSESQVVIGDATPPSEYFNRFWIDSLTHDPLSLELLGRRIGWDKVVLGSDFPFDMASLDPIAGVEAVEMSDEDRERVLSTNADAFLRPL